ncbi:low molecular weight protein-tyrosine-phosphatase [Pleionea sediminis]|uniref:low molecular weight protein-tyrosine-phosphatase n=1 Tax=Pleionea sediminis TaxID=2569479 RepID=UPI0011849AD7|nr:low molecular weight protein-tyrosine-phosphatase [Pleionea sediminis]
MTVKVLFVCLGNICRSPTAEGVFRQRVDENGLADDIEIESAGTSGYHAGEFPDTRAISAAHRRGYDISSITSRQVSMSDYEEFDYILAMDRSNLSYLIDSAPNHHESKIQLFLEFANGFREKEVPDPYYGGDKGFDHVIDLIESAADGLLNHLLEKREA